MDKLLSSQSLTADGRGKLHKFFAFLAILALGIFIGLLSLLRDTEFLGLILSLALFAIVIFLLYYFISDRTLRIILLVAFAIRFIIAIVNVYIMTLPAGGSDEVSFERVAWEHAQNRLGNEVAISRGGNAFYYSIYLSYIYLLVGRVPLLVQMANVLTGTLIVLFVFKCTSLISRDRVTSLFAAVIAAFFPTLILHSAVLLRETFIVLFMVASFYYFLRWYYKGSLRHTVLAVILALLAISLHSGLVLILLVYAAYFAFYRPKRRKWKFLNLKQTSMVLLATILLVITLGDKLSHYFPIGIGIGSWASYLSKFNSHAVGSGAAYLEGYVPNNLLDIIVQTPVRIIYLLLTPFPWQISSPTHLVGVVDVFLYIILIILAIIGIRFMWQRDRTLCIFMLMFFFMGTIMYAWGTSNFGTAIRHRQKLVWILIITASLGIHNSSLIRYSFDKRLK